MRAADSLLVQFSSSPPALFPHCREEEIPCSSLEGVSHLIVPSAVRHSSNSASTVWMTATSRRWVKRFLNTRVTALLVSGPFSCCSADLSLWSVLFAKPWMFFFLVITCLVISVTKSLRAAALVYKSDVVLQATCLIILHKFWHIDVLFCHKLTVI